LIGALNNDWTLNRTAPLRFHFKGPEGAILNYWIVDTQHPDSHAWQISQLAPRSPTVKDYAIAARFTDEGTGQTVLVAAGIAGIGTRAAGEFLTDEASLKQLAESSGLDWRKANFEVVLSSEVVNGNPRTCFSIASSTRISWHRRNWRDGLDAPPITIAFLARRKYWRNGFTRFAGTPEIVTTTPSMLNVSIGGLSSSPLWAGG
jgi:hypothetical protein